MQSSESSSHCHDGPDLPRDGPDLPRDGPDHHRSDKSDGDKSNVKESDNAIPALMSMLQDMVKSALDADTEESRSLATIGDEFSGIVFVLMQLGNMNLLTKSKAFEMIALFYHLDTGKFLHHTKFSELVMHEKCIKYAEKIKDNIAAYNRRTTKFKLDESIDQLATFAAGEDATQSSL